MSSTNGGPSAASTQNLVNGMVPQSAGAVSLDSSGLAYVAGATSPLMQSVVYGDGTVNTAVGMGHSRIAQGFPSSGASYGLTSYVTANNFMLGRRFNFIANFAVVGAGIDSVQTAQLPAMLALQTRPRYVFMEIGYNDWGNYTAAQVIARYISIRDAIIAAGITLIAFTDQAGGTLTAAQQIRQQIFNSWLMSQQGANARFVVIDAYSITVGNAADGTVGKLHSSYAQPDTIHPNVNGAYAIARESSQTLDPIVAKVRAFSGGINGSNQLAYNPNVEGNNASGANGWTAGTGITGNGPNQWNATRSGTATATTSVVLRSSSSYVSDGRKGNLLNIAFTGGAAQDSVTVTPAPTQNIRVLPWAFTGWNVNYRIKPTIPNGCHYLVTGAGTTANGPDPTGSYSTVIGTTFTDGTVTLLVVPAIDIGDTVQMVVEAFGGSLSGQIAVRVQLAFLDAGFSTLLTVDGGYVDATTGLSGYLPQAQVLATPPVVIPLTTAIIVPRILITGSAGATATIQIGQTEVRKIGS